MPWEFRGGKEGRWEGGDSTWWEFWLVLCTFPDLDIEKIHAVLPFVRGLIVAQVIVPEKALICSRCGFWSCFPTFLSLSISFFLLLSLRLFVSPFCRLTKPCTQTNVQKRKTQRRRASKLFRKKQKQRLQSSPTNAVQNSSPGSPRSRSIILQTSPCLFYWPSETPKAGDSPKAKTFREKESDYSAAFLR